MNPDRADEGWPPVVVAGVYQTGVNLMRDMSRKGVRTIGIDWLLYHEGFRSIYGESRVCPNPDTHPNEWVASLKSLSRTLDRKPVIIPCADQFVSAVGCHCEELADEYIFPRSAIGIQAAFANKNTQYELARRFGFPCPKTEYVVCEEELSDFASSARFPCLLKPRHQREWETLPSGNKMCGQKLVTASNAEELIENYRLLQPSRVDAIAQEVIPGSDTAKYCYLSVYGGDSSRIGYCVVRELRVHPPFFGSASVVEPVIEEEIESMCDAFLRKIRYVGLCEIELKRDSDDQKIKLIEMNPRFSITGDCARYAGVDIGWLHYLDLIGQHPSPVKPMRFNFRHVVLRRDIPEIPGHLTSGRKGWGELLRSYRPPLHFFDFDARDWRVTATTLRNAFREFAGETLHNLGLKS